MIPELFHVLPPTPNHLTYQVVMRSPKDPSQQLIVCNYNKEKPALNRCAVFNSAARDSKLTLREAIKALCLADHDMHNKVIEFYNEINK